MAQKRNNTAEWPKLALFLVLRAHMSNLEVLTPHQVAIFLARGVLVVEGILSAAEIAEAREGLHATLFEHGCDVTDLAGTGISCLVSYSIAWHQHFDLLCYQSCVLQDTRVKHSRSLAYVVISYCCLMAHAAQQLSKLSSTHGAGGILDLFYAPWKLKVILHLQLTQEFERVSLRLRF
jgi:hypothetical protein